MQTQARSQEFSWGGGVRIGNEDTNFWGSGGMLPRENFRNFGLPCTTFREFSWWRKREREGRVVKRKSQSPPLDPLKI